ncbi:ABC transporter ATP-binding protein [Leptospira interrogans serovar Canicola]|uniref:ATP-binding protein of an ABC transporter complex n=3 Tax=Leptospira interrogans TaxID=173 RepID=Q8EYQ7_LEPIN|nr:ABC transporter ATP-binding protein [Leptospira interrogans]AAN51354.1 ATP-binding protein of an ABC transporter complex [Leptospira interrogans serovar Lai str. 56601]AER04078.1 ATP-binding protein of an ABC transporter complex [Leptospira interrogans serovar Lai str. IPAV]MBE0303191.1 ABC transporter ATP-binding protein [Leptospira interrogans serovar Yeoncheon]QOI44238.1 ABC transporter ATP-binding protein [Leptospira interrogans serovar Canicola]QOI52261.1 ABC transporter ATP-binding pr
MIKVKNLSKFYGKKLAIDRLNFELGEGEIVGLLGLNGAGKTTTIRILTGYLIASDGICEIDGINTFENPLEVKKKIGYLPETPPLYPELSVQDYLKFAARIKQVSSELIDSEIDRVCERTFLTDVRKNDIETLSLGFRKRVGIAQALLGNPRIVILDEPVSGLDPKQIVEIRNLIHSLKDGHTILLSSHILPEVYKTCNRFLFLHQGRMVYQRDRKQLEEEMEKVSGLEVTLSETDVASGKKYLSSFPGVNVDKIRSIGEDSRGNTFLVSTSTEREFKEKLFASTSSSPRLEYIRKQEVTLEQIFMNQV